MKTFADTAQQIFAACNTTFRPFLRNSRDCTYCCAKLCRIYFKFNMGYSNNYFTGSIFLLVALWLCLHIVYSICLNKCLVLCSCWQLTILEIINKQFFNLCQKKKQFPILRMYRLESINIFQTVKDLITYLKRYESCIRRCTTTSNTNFWPFELLVYLTLLKVIGAFCRTWPQLT